jgi:hypothetical protein
MPAYLFIKTRITNPAQYQKYVSTPRTVSASPSEGRRRHSMFGSTVSANSSSAAMSS